MTMRPEFLLFVGLMAVGAMACRFGGFWLMRFVTITPRLEATLKAMPLAVMVGICTPAVLRGGWPEWIGLAVAVGAMRLIRNDSVAAIIAVAAVALFR